MWTASQLSQLAGQDLLIFDGEFCLVRENTNATLGDCFEVSHGDMGTNMCEGPSEYVASFKARGSTARQDMMTFISR